MPYLPQIRILVPTAQSSTYTSGLLDLQGSLASSSVGSERVISGGGYDTTGTSQSNVIDYFNIKSGGQAVDFGDQSVTRGRPTATASTTRGIFAGGMTSAGTIQNVIDYVTISTTGNATDFGDLSVARTLQGGSGSNGVRALFAGGDSGTGTYPSRLYNTIDYITIASTGNATDFGDLTTVADMTCGVSSPTRCAFGGRYISANDNTIDFVSFNTLGNALDFGDLSVSRYGSAGASSNTRGIFTAGAGNSPDTSMDFINIQSKGNATRFGVLSRYRNAPGGTSDSTSAVITGGSGGTSTTIYTFIEKITLANLGDGTFFGDLTVKRETTSLCGRHGGIEIPNYGRAERGEGRGMVGGGQSPSNTSTIRALELATLGDRYDFATTLTATFNSTGFGTPTRAFHVSGDGIGIGGGVIQYVLFLSGGATTDFGDTVETSSSIGSACSNEVRALFAGYYTTTYVNNIDYIVPATLGNALDFGDLTVVRLFQCGGAVANKTRALFGGGESTVGKFNVIDYVTIMTTGNAVDFGDLTVTRAAAGGGASETRALWAGGGTDGSGTPTNTIDYVEIASLGNATDFGDQTVARSAYGSCPGKTRFVMAGGARGNPFTRYDTIDYVEYATTGNAVSWGSLATVAYGPGASANNHGGL